MRRTVCTGTWPPWGRFAVLWLSRVLCAALALAAHADAVARTQRPTLAQYDQVTAEVGSPPALDVGLLVGWLKQTNTNTMNFLLWDTDGHQYKDMVR